MTQEQTPVTDKTEQTLKEVLGPATTEVMIEFLTEGNDPRDLALLYLGALSVEGLMALKGSMEEYIAEMAQLESAG